MHKKNVQQNLITCPKKFLEVTLGEWEGGVETNWPNLLDLLPRFVVCISHFVSVVAVVLVVLCLY